MAEKHLTKIIRKQLDGGRAAIHQSNRVPGDAQRRRVETSRERGLSRSPGGDVLLFSGFSGGDALKNELGGSWRLGWKRESGRKTAMLI